MKLLYTPGVCSLAAHIALEWTGADYELQQVNIQGEKSPELVKLNPEGSVPVLVDGDWSLTQNNAVLNYLADCFPDAQLGGDGSIQSRAEANRWLGMINSDLHPAFRPLFAGSAHLEDETAESKDKARAAKVIHHKLSLADKQLGQSDWLAGVRTFADPYLYVTCRWAEMLKVDCSDLANLQRFITDMEADEGVQKALDTEGLKPIAQAE